jgi:ubiquinone/menaquinone biosynthesis C-methylase UbiE
MSVARAREAYAACSAEYISLFGTIEAAAAQDRECVLAWARTVTGRIIDVGCGPGHWTNFLHEHGAEVDGVDPVPEFIEAARQRYSAVDYRAGHADRLDVEDASLGGILAWYSLIHTDPDQIGGLLTEFARCIRSGGSLLIGFFEGGELVPFDHAVTTAYFWPVGELSARVEQAGFEVTDVHTRTDQGMRAQGTIIAQQLARATAR